MFLRYFAALLHYFTAAARLLRRRYTCRYQLRFATTLRLLHYVTLLAGRRHMLPLLFYAAMMSRAIRFSPLMPLFAPAAAATYSFGCRCHYAILHVDVVRRGAMLLLLIWRYAT